MDGLFGKDEVAESRKKRRLGAPNAKVRDKSRWDKIWNEVVEVFGIESMSQTQKTRLGKIVRDLYDRNAVPGEIASRRKRWKWVMPENCLCTPEGLEKHWDLCKPNAAGEKSRAQIDEEYRRERERSERERAEALSPEEAKAMMAEWKRKRNQQEQNDA